MGSTQSRPCRSGSCPWSTCRAEDTAELMAVRGIQVRGNPVSNIFTGQLDHMAGLVALGVLIFSLIPVSEFFILYR